MFCFCLQVYKLVTGGLKSEGEGGGEAYKQLFTVLHFVTVQEAY